MQRLRCERPDYRLLAHRADHHGKAQNWFAHEQKIPRRDLLFFGALSTRT